MLRIYVFFAISFIHSFAFAQSEGSGGGISGAVAAAINAILGIIKSVFNYIKSLFEIIPKAIKWVGDLFIEVFKAAWDILRDLFVWIFEAMFKLAAGLLDGVADSFDIEGLANRFAGYWDLIPAEVAQIMQAIGVSSALAIVATGIIIRMGLQLIPFVRLGS